MRNEMCCLILTYRVCQSNLSLKIGTNLGITVNHRFKKEETHGEN